MHIANSISFAAALALVSCAGSAPVEPVPEQERSMAPPGYEGPDVAAEIDGKELQIKLTVNTGGYKLRLTETLRQAGATHVKICLEAPGQDEGVTQAIEDKALAVPMLDEQGPVHVYLQQRQRGTEYFVEPEYVLSRIVQR